MQVIIYTVKVKQGLENIKTFTTAYDPLVKMRNRLFLKLFRRYLPVGNRLTCGRPNRLASFGCQWLIDLKRFDILSPVE